MRLATAKEALRIDSESARLTGNDPEVFMETAGQRMAEVLCQRELIHRAQPIAIVCGAGNNGGDGFVIGRTLIARGFTGIEIFYAVEVSGGNARAELWHKQFSDLVMNGIEPTKIEKSSDLNLARFEVVIDALFGVGLNRPLGEFWVGIVENINSANKFVVSVDTPSGLHCDRGIPWPVAVRARWTLTCEISKPGFFLQQGSSFVGKILRISVGFPREIVLREACTVRLLTKRVIPFLFPERKAVTNKSKQGHLLVVGGSPGMLGALRLCAEAASRLGVGYVTVCSRAPRSALRELPADYLTLTLPEFFKSDLKRYSAVIVGPGLGQGPLTLKILKHLKMTHPRVLVDADALSEASQSESEGLLPFPRSWLVTPHAGELSKLLRLPALELEEDRLTAVELAAMRLQCLVLFKGFRTIVYNSRLKYIIGTGNAALAKAGTGDVLAGFIGSFMAQGLKTDEAAALGALIHGDLADRWVRSGRGSFSLKASDLLRINQLICKTIPSDKR